MIDFTLAYLFKRIGNTLNIKCSEGYEDSRGKELQSRIPQNTRIVKQSQILKEVTALLAITSFDLQYEKVEGEFKTYLT